MIDCSALSQPACDALIAQTWILLSVWSLMLLALVVLGYLKDAWWHLLAGVAAIFLALEVFSVTDSTPALILIGFFAVFLMISGLFRQGGGE